MKPVFAKAKIFYQQGNPTAGILLPDYAQK